MQSVHFESISYMAFSTAEVAETNSESEEYLKVTIVFYSSTINNKPSVLVSAGMICPPPCMPPDTRIKGTRPSQTLLGRFVLLSKV